MYLADSSRIARIEAGSPMVSGVVLTVPGLGNSGAGHWQTLWEEADPGVRRVVQRDSEQPVLAEWIGALDRAVAAATTRPLLAAHSLGCALVAHWFSRMRRPIRGALLVAPADVDSPAHTPPETRPFRPMPMDRLPFPTTVVAGSNDPYVTPERARWFANRWGSHFVLVDGAGHLNAESGLGAWPEGKRLLADLAARGGRDAGVPR